MKALFVIQDILMEKIKGDRHFQASVANAREWAKDYDAKRADNRNYFKEEFLKQIRANDWNRWQSYAFALTIWMIFRGEGICEDDAGLDSDMDYIIAQLDGNSGSSIVIHFPGEPTDQIELWQYARDFVWADENS